MTTPAEDFLFESENEICAARDYLIAICAALTGMKEMDQTQTAAIFRMADNALGAVKKMETNFTEASQATFDANAASLAA
ncbi:hypothetical protein [Devosia naphthalenivorans]|uniref:hypothetical protein n=1 Tax=Devosia naphthalenivorans TaxID=2082392 RepID=UPI0013B05BD6|nr:hypothetical protein [Devosia naphthalenivorans]